MKCIALLSGGFDSAVAISLARKNKIEVIALHCTNYPFTDSNPETKALALARALGVKKMFIADCGPALEKVAQKCDPKHYFVHLKRLFYALAQKLAEQEGADFILTGENLAQVSSQTLQNLSVIGSSVFIPVLRPLLSWDKQEIINEAKKIGTYEISCGPEQCDVLGSKHPSTQANLELIEREEDAIQFSKLAEEIFQKMRAS
ncbi:MAG: 7-cyano-7-deazaguanine synthase [Candidatus Diapherotrites archaeon]